jgi:hypothetical protein
VHNAPAGYWSKAEHPTAATTSVCAFDSSLAAGLHDALVMVQTQRQPVALIAYDVPYPEPLASVRPIPAAFGVALLLLDAAVAGVASLARLELSPADAPPSGCADAALEALRAGVPAARALPLLQALAHGAPASLIVEAGGRSRLRLRVEPAQREG